MIDRIVLNILVGNGDAHVKNWTFIYPDGSRPQLSPAYDIVPTVLYVPMTILASSSMVRVRSPTSILRRSADSPRRRDGTAGLAASAPTGLFNGCLQRGRYSGNIWVGTRYAA